MAGRNMNVYFQEETYSKIKNLVAKREISRFINEAVEEKLKQRQQQQKEELRKKLIVGYQSRIKNKKLQKILLTYGEMSWEDLSAKLEEQEKNDDNCKK
ncbi:hypothetical protein [endosymbiont GvMRE of Glomus versiforme]|uniref:hypothetical protein n=1 Tax=endosymbiont GvMRE of Glomus versiforme TaxID=2039283 RepID=UPI000EE35939|nr:hypothetical protein [endosymbiont GvMRE of Glomus versiforme]RHZ37779.1 hypothetical protein GvMRE_I1g322 [endosymbiont GvMRE of Glomus versiforme]